MNSKVRVYGKAQNRTVLGIVNAYLKIYPESTLSDLRTAFPESLAEESGVKEIFLPLKQAQIIDQKDDINKYFTKPDEVLTLADGQKVAVCSIWTKGEFNNMEAQAKEYGIEVARFDPAEKGIGKKGSYHLEYLNGFMPIALEDNPPRQKPKPEPVATAAMATPASEPVAYVKDTDSCGCDDSSRRTAKLPWWLWALLGLMCLAIIGAYFCPASCTREGQRRECRYEKKGFRNGDQAKFRYRHGDRGGQMDATKVAQIQEELDNVVFPVGSATLTPEAKTVLNKLASVMQQNPNLDICIEGHSSPDGDAAQNMALSKKRAAAAANYLISDKGIARDRLYPCAAGENINISTDNSKNRCVEFLVMGPDHKIPTHHHS